MKKIVVFALIATMILSLSFNVVAEEKNFNDLNKEHWAYSLIQQLVGEGIINGYSDETFRPENTVTRAEFAKIFGKGRKIKPADFLDLPRVHWAYSYVMTSGMDIEYDRFYPDRELTRAEALKALYDRYGDKTKCYAPSVVTSQYADKDAVAWAYSKKLMIGDDGINLRLEDTITRAEAVALVLRARDVNNTAVSSFAELADEKVLEGLYGKVPAFSEIEYSKDKTITNGEFADVIAKMVGFNADSNQYKPAYEGKYASQIAYLTASVWGKENNTPAFEKSELTVKNAVTAYVFATTLKANSMLSVSGKNEIYPDVTPSGNMEKSFLVYAYENGMFLTSDGTLQPDKKITMKELISFYIIADNSVGFEESYNGSLKNESIKLNLYDYPYNSNEYYAVLESVPNDVYEKSGLVNPKEDTLLVKEYSDVFEDITVQIKAAVKQTTLGATVTYYPTLVSVDSGNVKFVIKLDVTENLKETKYSDVFKTVNVEDKVIEAGVNYIVVSTNTPLIYGLDFATLSVDKII